MLVPRRFVEDPPDRSQAHQQSIQPAALHSHVREETAGIVACRRRPHSGESGRTTGGTADGGSHCGDEGGAAGSTRWGLGRGRSGGFAGGLVFHAQQAGGREDFVI